MRLDTVTRAILTVCAPIALCAQERAPGPPRHDPKPTIAAITAADLMTRLYIFADDSMQGRQTGTQGHVKSSSYIAAELQRLGLKPAGDNGTYFQSIPVVQRVVDTTSSLSVDGATLRALHDFVPQTGGRGAGDPRPLAGVPVIYGGVAGDTSSAPLSADQIRGKVVLITAAAGGGRGGRGGVTGGRGGGPGAGPLAEAVAIATIVGDAQYEQTVRASSARPGTNLAYRDGAQNVPAGPLTLVVTAQAAEVMLGMPVSQATKGALGKTLSGTLRFIEAPVPARNIVAVLEGRDPSLKGQYVAFGAHPDHVGFRQAGPVDHDSLHLYNQARFAIVGMYSARGGPQPTAQDSQAVRNIRINLDSVRSLRAVRRDSINNGADDDGSGSVTTLEVAEAFARLPAAQRPRRSLLFVWHVAEENGLWGSRFFTDHPTVPRDSIVAQLNMDMVGRGEKADLPVGSPTYLDLVGSRRLSTELGDLVESVNKAQKIPFAFDYRFDANGHPENIYCRSDHYNYARYGIPIVFFTTGLHGDYHQPTDEPQYIAYDHMARIGQLVFDVGMKVANLDHRLVADKPKPDPNSPCRQ